MFFDNIGVTLITGPILEETHYYPFGLTMAGISQTAPLKIQGRRKFNGITFNHEEFSDGSGLELYTANYRSLDPQIGRWWQIDPKAGSFLGMSPYAAMGNNPLLYSDPNGDCIICLVILGTAVMNGLVNVGSQALKGNVNNLGQGLEYFAVGAVAGAAAAVPGSGMFLAGGIQAVGNKGVQYLNGQWDPSDINSVGDVANLTLDVGLDFFSAGAGAKLGEAIVKNTGWFTSVSMSGQFVKNGTTLASGVRLSGSVEVTASRVGSRAAQVAELEAANIAKDGTRVFRAVDATEAAIIRKTGKFSLQAGGVEAKYFARSLKDAHWYGQRLYPNGYSIIQGTVKNSVNASQYWFPYIDVPGAYVFPKEILPFIFPY